LTLYLSPSGSDSNNGLSAASPLLTTVAALAAVKAAVPQPTGNVLVYIASGTYVGQSVIWNYNGAATTTFTAAPGAITPPVFDGQSGGTAFLIKGWANQPSRITFNGLVITNYWMALDFGTSSEAKVRTTTRKSKRYEGLKTALVALGCESKG
jgi:hypothetical protein